jgi:hypothetical protein
MLIIKTTTNPIPPGSPRKEKKFEMNFHYAIAIIFNYSDIAHILAILVFKAYVSSGMERQHLYDILLKSSTTFILLYPAYLKKRFAAKIFIQAETSNISRYK